MRSLTRLLLAGTALVVSAPPAHADLTVLDGTGASQVMFDFTCFSTKHCSAHVNVDILGAAIFTSANPGLVTLTGTNNITTVSTLTTITNPVSLAAETTKVIGTVNIASAQTLATLTTITNPVSLAAETTKVIGTVNLSAGQTLGTLTTITNPVAVTIASVPSHAVTIASNGAAAGAMVDFLTTRQTMAAGTAAVNSQAIGGQYNLTPITLTNAQGSALQLDANGYTKVNCTVGCSGGTFNNNADNVATSATNGQTAAFNYVWDGSNWDRLYGDSVNGVKVNIVAGGGTGGGATGDVNNAVSAAGYQQMLAIGRYNTTQPTLTDTRYNTLQVSNRGEVLVTNGASGIAVNATIVGGLLSAGPAVMAAAAPITIATDQTAADPCMFAAKTSHPFSQATSTQLFAGTASVKTYFCSIALVGADAENVSLVAGTGTVCATGTAALIGATTAANGLNLAANGGFTLGNGGGTVAAGVTNADNICLLQSGSGRVAGVLTYVKR